MQRVFFLFVFLLCWVRTVFAQELELGQAPVGTVRCSRPEIVWRVVVGNASVTEATMTLNGKPITAKYLPERKIVSALPEAALPTGKYTVHCELKLSGENTLSKDWSFVIPATAKPEIPKPGTKEAATLEIINNMRAKVKLPPFRLDERLCAAAAAYSDQQNRELKGEVTEGIPLSQLVLAYAYPATGGQVPAAIALSPLPMVGLIQTFFDAPYDRPAFLQPGKGDLGIGLGGVVTTFVFSLSDEEVFSLYPGNGQTDVPTAWLPTEGAENPMKVHGFNAVSTKLGYPITFYLIEPTGEEVTEISATLTDKNGKPVPFYLNTPKNDSRLTNGAILIPKRPLESGMTYRVTLKAQRPADPLEGDISLDWTFTTRGQEAKNGKP